ncbi:hypothetical protein BGZ63DRAFT_389194 [Mariannaea sp. PMI_226]|nr:hypothetical protein BGZ63DRAFT_389194 [Mariannaea sp. PMI_226]
MARSFSQRLFHMKSTKAESVSVRLIPVLRIPSLLLLSLGLIFPNHIATSSQMLSFTSWSLFFFFPLFVFLLLAEYLIKLT